MESMMTGLAEDQRFPVASCHQLLPESFSFRHIFHLSYVVGSGAVVPCGDRPSPALRHTEDGSFFLGFLPTWRWVLRLLSLGSCSKIKVERYPEGRSLRTGDRRPLPLRWEQILDGSLGDVGRPLMSM